MQYIKDIDRAPRPQPVNNSSLEGIESLAEGKDYTLKSPATWDFIREQYPGSGPDITRQVKADGRVEMPRVTYKVCRQADLKSDGKSDDARDIQLSPEVFPPAVKFPRNGARMQSPHSASSYKELLLSAEI